MARALLAAGLVGVFIATPWSFAAEVGGCQAEGGAAAAMASSPMAIAEALAADKAHAIKAVCVVHNETSTGVTSRIAPVRKAIDAAGDREIVFPLGPVKKGHMKGADYLYHFVLPNFYFHVTTTYAILRHNGVELGKGDYMRPPA